RLAERLHRGLCAQVPQKAKNQPARDLQPIAAILEGAMDARDPRLEPHPPIGMGLRVEENLGMPHALAGGAFEIGPGELVEILLLEQYPAAGVIDVEEGLQVTEDIGASEFLDRGIRQADPVAPGEPEHQLGLERALAMEMKLRFG